MIRRLKLEELDNCLFLVVKMLRYDKTKAVFLPEQLSMVPTRIQTEAAAFRYSLTGIRRQRFSSCRSSTQLW